MDVALTAKRLGVSKVTLICLEQANEMPASAEEVARKAMGIAARICVYTNGELTVESL